MTWSFLFDPGINAPDDPSMPFSDIDIIFTDSIRCIIIVVGLIVVVVTVFAMTRVATPGQFIRFACLAVFMASAIFTEIAHLGDYGYFRLYLHLIATVCAAWGLFSFFRFETPTAVRPDTRNVKTEDQD